MEQARERLADAQKIVGMVHPAVVVSAAYYAILNAARAALSEDAAPPNPAEAADFLDGAAEFVAAVERLLSVG